MPYGPVSRSASVATLPTPRLPTAPCNPATAAPIAPAVRRNPLGSLKRQLCSRPTASRRADPPGRPRLHLPRQSAPAAPPRPRPALSGTHESSPVDPPVPDTPGFHPRAIALDLPSGTSEYPVYRIACRQTALPSTLPALDIPAPNPLQQCTIPLVAQAVRAPAQDRARKLGYSRLACQSEQSGIHFRFGFPADIPTPRQSFQLDRTG